MARNSIKAVNESDVTQLAEETVEFDEDTLKAITEVYKNKGNDEYNKKDFSKAIHFYTEGLKVNCKGDELNAKLYSNRAIAHYYLGNHRDSLNDARAATELLPDYLKAIVRGASACIELKQFEEAKTWCEKGLTIDKSNRNLLELRTKAIKGQELQGFSVEEGNDHSYTHSEKDTVKGKSRLPSTVAKSPIKIASENDVTPRARAEACKNEGNDEYNKKDFSKAIHFYTEGIKVNCKDDELNAKLYSNRATVHFYLGNFPDSLNDARAATELRPDYLKAIVRGASACVELKQFEEAIKWCDKGLAIDKSSRNLLELKAKAIKGQELQAPSGDEAKDHSETQSEKGTIQRRHLRPSTFSAS